MSRVKPTNIPGPRDCHSINASIALVRVMHSLSEQYFDVPWHPGLDRILWREMNAPMKLSKSDAHCLRYLHEASGGWWSWHNSEADGPSFVPTHVWDELH